VFEQAAALFVGKTSLSVTERLDEYRLVFEAADIAPQAALTQALQLLTLAEKLSARDRFELQVEFQGDALSLTEVSDAERASLTSHLQAHEDQGEARYELIVKKGGGGALSIYSLSAFGRYLENDELTNVLAALGSRFKEGISFECLCAASACGSDTLRFWPQGQVPTADSAAPSLRSQVLTSFRDNSYSAGLKTDLLPSDFYLLQRTNVAAIDAFMDKACALLCAIYLASGSQIQSSGRLSYKLVGYKSIEGEAAFADFLPALPGLYKIYDWAYGVGGSADRIGLARNVVSLQVDRLQDVSDHPSLWNAIHSNYQIYLKGNVASYLEVKSKIAEFLVESTAKAHALVEDLVDSLKNSVFVMLTFLLTVVVVNGFKDTGAAVIFSAAYFWIVVVLCVVLTVWVIGTCRGAIRRFDNSAQTTAEVLQLAYGRILLSSEIKENIEPINIGNRKYLVRQCWRYALYWLLIAVLLMGGFGLGYSNIGKVQTVPAPTTGPAKQAVDSNAVQLAPTRPASKAPPQPPERNPKKSSNSVAKPLTAHR
jgi:hypothetical protein